MSIDLNTKTVLVIDDIGSVRNAIGQMLSAMGINKIDFAADGDESLRRMAIRSYDIILCDYNLGDGRDGMQILEEAKQHHWIGLTTVFIMITAEASVSMVLGAIEYRPDDYLVKPITRAMLQERLPRLIARKEGFSNIERLMREGDLAQAIKMAAAQLREQPHHAIDLMQIQAELLIRLGQFETAGAIFEAAASVRETFWVKLGRGQICYYLGDYVEAAAAFSALIKENALYLEAYDWLARVQQALGNFQEAKEVLASAAKISSRSIRRAQILGEVSLRTDDISLAEQAYRNAVRLGRFSVYSDPNDSARLVQVLLERGNYKDVSRVIKDARKQYQGDIRATLALSIAEAAHCHQLMLSDGAVRMLEEAIGVYQEARNTLPPDLAIKLAQLCHLYDRDLEAAGIITHVVFYHIEDSVMIDRAREVFASLGMMQVGAEFINDLWQKVVEVNNTGVRLFQEEKLSEARIFLEKAASDMYFNSTININAARVLLMIMEQQGTNNDFLTRAKKYLDAVPNAQTHNDKFQRLRGIWIKLVNQSSVQ